MNEEPKTHQQITAHMLTHFPIKEISFTQMGPFEAPVSQTAKARIVQAAPNDGTITLLLFDLQPTAEHDQPGLEQVLISGYANVLEFGVKDLQSQELH